MAKTDRGETREQRELYALLERLDRLEELIEDLDALGVESRAEAEARMREIHALLDGLDPRRQTT